MKQLVQSWSAFEAVWFGIDNAANPDKLDGDARIVVDLSRQLAEMDAEGGLAVMPFMERAGSRQRRWCVIARDDESAQECQGFLQAFVGTRLAAWRRLADATPNPPLDHAIAYARSPRRVFVIDEQSTNRDALRRQLVRLLSMLKVRPKGAFAARQTFGELIVAFSEAIESGDADLAYRVLHDQLRVSGQLNYVNYQFLRLRIAAVEERWDQIVADPNFVTLRSLRCPASVSDVFARTALRLHGEWKDSFDAAQAVERFAGVVRPQWGSVITSAGRVRSGDGALFYVLDELSKGVPVPTLRARCAPIDWFRDERVRAVLDFDERTAVAGAVSVDVGTPTVLDVEAAITTERYDDALALIRASDLSDEFVPVVVQLIGVIGSHAMSDVVLRFEGRLPEPRDRGASNGLGETRGWSDCVQRWLAGDMRDAEFSTWIDEQDPASLGDEEELASLTTLVQTVSDEGQAGSLATLMSYALRRLRLDGEGVDEVKANALRMAVIEMWGYLDRSGKLERAESVIGLVSDSVQSGVSEQELDGVIDVFEHRWREDGSALWFPIGLQMTEAIVPAARDKQFDRARNLLAQVCGRVGEVAASRFDAADLMVAQSLADECALADIRERVAAALETVDAAQHERPGVAGLAWSGKVGIYSLDESSTKRAADVLHGRIPNSTIVVNADHVATEAIRSLARSADIFAFVWRCAKHAAEAAVKQERSGREFLRVPGRGSTSIVRAVLGEVNRLEGLGATA